MFNRLFISLGKLAALAAYNELLIHHSVCAPDTHYDQSSVKYKVYLTLLHMTSVEN